MKAPKNDFLQYDWRLDGEDAEFSVDLSLYDGAPDARCPILAFIGCRSKEEGAELSAAELRRMDAFASKLRRRLDAVFAGTIETSKIRQYYLYLPSKAEYDSLKQLAEKERGFSCMVGGKREEDWASYFRILYPDDAKYQTVLNSEIIEQHYELGDSEAPRRLNLHLSFGGDPARQLFAEAARSEGFALGGDEDNDSLELPCGIVLHRICALKKRDIDAVTVRTVRLAEEHGGKLLFWDCPIVPGR